MSDTLLAERPPQIRIPKAVLAAGRQAFLKHRRTLDDLHEFFEDDLTEFLCAIYESMRAAARLETV